ncbi:MAG: SDR family NAD(P)-dependent oxidoreductase, partial [Myxococcota bacterium]
SIKRVEILSGLRERLPDAPPIGAEQLGQLQTLGQIVEFLGGSTSASETPAASTSSTADPGAAVAEVLLAVVAEKTGYPTDMLELSMGLDADLGIDSIKRVEILSVLRERLPEAPAIGPEQLGTLSTLGEIVAFLGGVAPVAEAPKPTPSAAIPTSAASPTPDIVAPAVGVDRYEVRWNEGVPMSAPATKPTGTVVVTGPDILHSRVAERLRNRGLETQACAWGDALPQTVGGLVIVAPAQPDDRFVREVFSLVRDGASRLRAAQGWLAAVSRLGGDFGLSNLADGATPQAGALAGLVKTLGHEWSDVTTHAIDLPLEPSDEAIDTVFEAALQGGPREIGFCTRLGTPRLVASKLSSDALTFGRDDVVIVTGGARGVTASVAKAIAAAGGPTLVLVGRSVPPRAEPAWLAKAASEAEVKQALLEHAEQRPTPRALAGQCRAVFAARQITATLASIEALGARAEYRSLDVRDTAAVQRLVTETGETLGPVTAFVHGAGVLADKHFVDKHDDDFDRVYGTKVEGAANFLAALASSPLRAVVLFSSSTARFGRRGQADYAMANEVLNKLAAQLRQTRPEVRTVAIGWGPWDGGMVTPALAAMFRDEGVTTIDLDAGAQLVLRELAADGPAEVVVVGAGSRLALPAAAPAVRKAAPPEHPTVFERKLSVDDHPFLASHVLDGKAVLPSVMMLEWFAHAALAEHPGLRFVGTDDLRIFRGIRLGRSERLLVRVEAGPAVKSEGQFVIPVALCSGGSNGHRVVHAQAQVVLASEADHAPAAELPTLPTPTDPVGGAYDGTLFHGEAFHGLQAIEGLADAGIVAKTRSAPNPTEWMNAPVRRRWITDPLAVDSGLQAVIVWTSRQAGAVSLPHRLGRYRQFEAFPTEGARVGVRVTRQGAHGAVADLDWVDDQGRLIARLTDCEYTLDAGLTAAFDRNRVE